MMAFAITVDGFDPMVAAAESRAKATFDVFRSAQDAGYTSVTFSRIKARRMPALDGWAAEQKKPRLTALNQAEHEARKVPSPNRESGMDSLSMHSPAQGATETASRVCRYCSSSVLLTTQQHDLLCDPRFCA